MLIVSYMNSIVLLNINNEFNYILYDVLSSIFNNL